jgi:hypothetical protein
MSMNPQAEDKATSECRALVPVGIPAEGSSRVRHANAAFITQLSANVKGFAQYRVKRRVKPEVGAKNYRTTVADALAYQPLGTKLNYCA